MNGSSVGRIFLFLVWITSPLIIHAQDLALADDFSSAPAFRSTSLINMQSTTMQARKSFEFSIRHRFGEIEINKDAIKNFFGLDQVANIRFGFIFPILDNLQVGAGRTKSGKTYDAEVKILAFSQSEEAKMPVSVAAYFDAAINSDDFTPVAKNAYYENGITPFYYKFNHRLSYNSQLIVSRKFCDALSFEVSPTFIYRNLVNAGSDNKTFALPVCAAIKTGMNSSVLLEYGYRFNDQPENKLYPLSVAMEFGTVGHVFQIVISSSQEILEQSLYTTEVSDYSKRKFLLGFNIKKTFWRKKLTN